MIPSSPVHRVAAALAACALAFPARGQEPPRELHLDVPSALTVTGVALGASLASELLKPELAPHACRICGTTDLDRWARGQLLWAEPTRAARASDVLLVGVPVVAVGALMVSAGAAGGGKTALQDLLVVAEATSVAVLATQVVKYAAGRVRPYAWADPASGNGPDAYLSLWSGHTATTFAAASAAGTVARLRGYRSWPWIMGVGLAGAATCGYLRIAADRHWATDVLAGAAAGSLAGFGLPVWLHSPRGAGAGTATLPLGISGTF